MEGWALRVLLVVSQVHLALPMCTGVLTSVSMIGTLTTMFNRTTSILPEGLFASLGVPRADENLADVKHVRVLAGFPFLWLEYWLT